MNTCKDCKHWSLKSQDSYDPDEVAGNCRHSAFVYDCRTPKDGLHYWDFEGYRAGFDTGPDFGCIHWKAK